MPLSAVGLQHVHERSKFTPEREVGRRHRQHLAHTLSQHVEVVNTTEDILMKPSFAVQRIPVVLALCLVAAVTSIASEQTIPYVGTWKLNVPKSKSSAGPLPKELTVINEADGPGFTSLSQGVDAEGKPMKPDENKVSYIFDGKEHPATSPDYDTQVVERTAATGFAFTRKKAGKVVQTGTVVVSRDGKTMTATVKGKPKGETLNINGDGWQVWRPRSVVAVYDKQ